MLTSLKRNVLVYREPVDMRRSYDGLHALVKAQDVLSGDVFLFVSRDRKRAKALFWDGSGLNIWMKRLEKGLFADIFARHRITSSELRLFFEGSKFVAKQVSPEDMTHRYSA
jgi:transposase